MFDPVLSWIDTMLYLYSGSGKCVLSGAETRGTTSRRAKKMQRYVLSCAKTVTLMVVSFQGVETVLRIFR